MRILAAVSMALMLVGVAGCVPAAPPSPASIRTSGPPWPAPRDGVSYIEAAGLPKLPLNDTSDPYVITLTVVRNGAPVEVPANVGVDRIRAWQAPVHTHDASGQLWLEGQGNRAVTLGQFFAVWGVRFDSSCLGDVCGRVEVVVDDQPAANPSGVVLRDVRARISVRVTG